MQVRDCMKRNVVAISASATIGEAAKLLAESHIGMLPVVDQNNKLVGHLQLRDLLALVMPKFIRLVEDFDFVHDFGAVEKQHPSKDVLTRPVSQVMQKPLLVEETCGLVRAFAILNEHQWYDLPIVDQEGHLVGVASRVDIAAALLAGWQDQNTQGATG